MMEKNGCFRVGVSKLFRRTKGSDQGYTLGPMHRARGEGASNLWILGVYSTKHEALLAEEWFSVEWQLPKACFRVTNNKKMKYAGLYAWATQESLDSHHAQFSIRRSFDFYAAKLSEIDLDIHAPFWSQNNEAQTYEFSGRKKRFKPHCFATKRVHVYLGRFLKV